jgi:UDP-glucose:(heptosyl)LPS alpha-1,3-glucosyltransferase
MNDRGWSLADALELRLDRRSVGVARSVVVNSTMAGEELTRWYGTDPARIRLVRNGVDLDLFQPDQNRAAPDLGLVFLGSGFARKGLETAIASLVHLPGETLTVLGQDPHEKIYRQQAERLGLAQRVRFLGKVDRPETVLPAARALVLPTRYDPFANACLEAMACGVPVVTTRRNGAAEVLPHPWMAIADPRDDVALAEVLKRVLEDASLGPQCRAEAEQYASVGAYGSLCRVLEEAQA